MTDDPDEVRRTLAERTLDLRTLDLDGFRRWLSLLFGRWERDPVFAQRVRIRDRRRAHPRIRELERTHRRAVAADAAGPHFVRLAEIDRALDQADRALAGLAAALETVTPERHAALRAKAAAFHDRARALRAERAALVATSPERQHLHRAAAEMDRFRAEIGLDREEARLRELLTGRGRRSGRAGTAFEEAAGRVTRERIVPGVAAGEASNRVRVLRGVRFGAAQVEFDFLVVRLPDDPSWPVGVLAAVEAKRNVNDLGHGFVRRQRDLAWLTGDRDRYDPAEYRTRAFPTGHFDRPATHDEGGEAFRFGPDSFARYARDPRTGYFLSRLHFVSRPGWLWGVSAAGLARIATRIATDERWDGASDSDLADLRAWCQGLAGPVESPDVLRLYLPLHPGTGSVILAGTG